MINLKRILKESRPENTNIQEGNKDTYTWEQINKAFMKQGTSPKKILHFLSVLKKT